MNTRTNVKVNNVRAIIVANTLMEKLIDFIRDNKDDFIGDCDDLEENLGCIQARSIWTTIALLKNLSPDTYSGDWAMMELWDSCGLGNQMEENDFDLFMWGELC